MKKYLPILVGAALTALVGCHVVSGEQTINEYSDDAAITAHVKAALLHDKYVTSLPIHVETENGMVVLSGFVKTYKQKAAADLEAHRVKNVKSVKNNLIVH